MSDQLDLFAASVPSRVCKQVGHFARFDVVLATGERLLGVTIHGNGGVISAERIAAACAERAAEGRPLPVYEPQPGHVLVRIGETRLDPGEGRAVPAAGATFRLSCCVGGQ